jgi:DnaD/phage-associated family protein
MGIESQKAAAEYLKKYAQRQETVPLYMRALGLGDRMPVASEEKFLASWQEMGFPPETVAIAYDKTVLKCHELKWPYCNGILKRWHESGLHTPEEVQSGDKPAAAKPTVERTGGDELRKYVQDLHRDRR